MSTVPLPLPVPWLSGSSVTTFDPLPYSSGERKAHPAGRGGGCTLPLEALAEIAAGLVTTAPFGQHSWTESTRRRYTMLIETHLYDAWLIEWSPAASLDLHDHGGSQGSVAVATGTLIETHSDLRWRHPLRTRVLGEGTTSVIPASRVHEVYNPGPAGALSVHVYSPPLNSMTFYDHRPESFLERVSTAEGDFATLEAAIV